VKFEWDENKRRSNIRKHGIDFVVAAEIFGNDTWEWPDARATYGEDRWRAFGWVDGILILVVYTERGDVLRIISARKVEKHEADEYFRNSHPQG
jgi:uncharacterized DUF497 family protein